MGKGIQSGCRRVHLGFVELQAPSKLLVEQLEPRELYRRIGYFPFNALYHDGWVGLGSLTLEGLSLAPADGTGEWVDT